MAARRTTKVDAPASTETEVVEVEKASAKKASALRVIAPLVQAVVGGRPVQFYSGDLLPAGTSEQSVAHLKSLGYVEEIDAPGDDK